QDRREAYQPQIAFSRLSIAFRIRTARVRVESSPRHRAAVRRVLPGPDRTEEEPGAAGGRGKGRLGLPPPGLPQGGPTPALRRELLLLRDDPFDGIPAERAAGDAQRLEHPLEVRRVEPAHELGEADLPLGRPELARRADEDGLAAGHGLGLADEAFEVEVVLADVRRRPGRDQRRAE